MTSEAFEVGDKVQLKSGGPVMTVVLADNQDATCVWFDEKQAKQNAVFPAAALKRLSADDET